MNRDECPSSQDGVAEILKITKELLDLANSNPKISSWDKYNWIFAIAAGLGGIVAAPFSAGLSLSITIASIGWVGVDIIKKIREFMKP
ncbi:MAG: hypothetical protein L3J05_07895 [Robiginitomaculum sp.]|nr:hypothetical protein [Robiginitomaculum sp.]